jgi:hypothetical protein
MWDMGYGDGTVEEGLESCISDSGCPSDICDSDPGLCEEAISNFNDARN